VLKLCSSTALGIALAVQPAWALRVDVRPDPLPPGTVEQYFTGTVVVDGIPVFKQGYRIWTGARWVPMINSHRPGERPIPRRQRRLE
jgi:hypothetical protein